MVQEQMAHKSQWLTTEVCLLLILVSLAVRWWLCLHHHWLHFRMQSDKASALWDIVHVREKENVAKKYLPLNLPPGSNRHSSVYFRWPHLNSSLVESAQLLCAQEEREMGYC